MNYVLLKKNEFVIAVEEIDGQIQFVLRNPHTELGSDGLFDTRALSAVYALVHMGKKLKRKPISNDEGDPELHGG